MKRLVLAAALLLGLAAPLAHAQSVGSSAGFATALTRVLGSLRGANFNSTSDQAIAIPVQVTKYLVTGIYVTNCSGSVSLAVGGFYGAASKGSPILVAAAQVYSALTSSTVLLATTLAAGANTTALTGANVYLSLTTAQGSAMICDVYVVGIDLT